MCLKCSCILRYFFAAHLFFCCSLFFFGVFDLYLYSIISYGEQANCALCWPLHFFFRFALHFVQICKNKKLQSKSRPFREKKRSICNFAFLSFFFKFKLNIHHSIFIILCVDRIYQISFFAQFSHSV